MNTDAGKANEQCVSSTMTTKVKASVQTLKIKKKKQVKIGDYSIHNQNAQKLTVKLY